MTMPITRVVTWLLVQGPLAGRDTVLVRQIPGETSLFEQITGIAGGILTISILILTIALVPAALSFRRRYQRINTLLDRVYGDVVPLVQRASGIADDVKHITASVREDVDRINRTIAMANDRLIGAVRMTEDRLREVNALLVVAQREAESMFVSTASAVHGVRAGASVLRDSAFARPADGVDDADDLDEEYDEYDDLDDYEVSDGDDDAPAAGPEPEKPRIKRRARRDGVA
jgi:uncharacterized protein YoxC